MNEDNNLDNVAENETYKRTGAKNKRKLSRIDIEGAEDGGAIVTHSPALPDRVKGMDIDGARPKKYAFDSKEAAIKHISEHIHHLA